MTSIEDLFDWPGKSADGVRPEHPALLHMLEVGARKFDTSGGDFRLLRIGQDEESMS
ncbi:hypothetical protein [Palleronia sediminis]|uniref:hypothetical protein n=1 Tax=Palleronia sediminis TaxID=2547833 RepID=UPI0014554C82|nr:hypothetical protein [Palleronia sediminis]